MAGAVRRYEIRSGDTFLAVRYSLEAAERCAEEFGDRWPEIRIVEITPCHK